MKRINKAMSLLLTLCMALSMLPWAALPAWADAPTAITADTKTWSGAMAVNGNVTIDGDVSLTGDTALTVAGGKTLTVNGGILGYDNGGNSYSLAISGFGELVVKNNSSQHAGVDVGSLTLESGTVEATNENGHAVRFKNGMTVDGGTLTATGKGDGSCGILGDAGKDLTVNGGAVTAAGQGFGVSGSVTLAGGALRASSYDTADKTVTVAAGYTYTLNGADAYTGELGADPLAAAAGKWLRPHPVATIGNTKYFTLQAAVEAAEANDEILLMSDVTLDSADLFLTVEKPLTLDLNDHSILYTGSAGVSGASIITVKMGGDLTLTDGAENLTTRYVTLNADGRGTGFAASRPAGTEGEDYLAVAGGCIAGNSCGTNNFSGQGGGVSVLAGGKFTMKGGTIAGNCSGYSDSGNPNGYGGGVQVDAGGKFTMEGGTISGNVANGNCGGGVRVYGGTFTMTDGTISGNTATCDGGGVYVEVDGRFTMKGGTISGNTAGGAGGGVCVEISTFDMTGGTISGNTAAGTHSGFVSGCGGGVFVAGVGSENGRGSFTMCGGMIDENTAAAAGGGVYSSDGTFTISGGAAVTENKSGSAANNVYLPGRETITVAGALTGTGTVGVTAAGGQAGTVVAKGDYDKDKNPGGHKLTDADAAAFSYDGDAFCVSLDSEGRAALHVARLVIFHANDGAATPKTAVQKVPYGVPAPLKANAFTRAGHTFTGWNTLPAPRAADPGTKYEDQASVTLTEDLTLYAQWRKNEFTVADVPAQTYTGKPLTPALTVKDKTTGKELTAGTDYTVSWANNTDAGKNTASVTVTGAGGYCAAGAVVKTFTITANISPQPSPQPSPAYDDDDDDTPAPSVTAPVSGAAGTPPITVTVTDSKASIDALTDRQLGDIAGSDAPVVFDLSGLGKDVTAVQFPAEAFTKLAEALTQRPDGADRSVTFQTANGSVTLDAKAVQAIAASLAGGTLTLNFALAGVDALSSAQRSALAGKQVVACFSLSLLAGKTEIVDFGGGFVTVVVPLTPDADKQGRFCAVYCVGGDGTLERMATRYADEELHVDIPHLSDYAVVYEPRPFKDVTESDWFWEPVYACFERGIMNGVSDDAFEPEAVTSRAMIVTVLRRLEGGPEYHGTLAFEDVEADRCYTEAVRWAAGEGIVNGLDETRFGPDEPVTREQLAAILYRYARYKGCDVSASGDLSRFADGGDSSEWARQALAWAVGAGIVSGTTDARGSVILAPRGSATRAQVAAMLLRFCEKTAK